MEKSMTFWNNYCEIRDKLGLTDYKVAKETGIIQGNFSFWKDGRMPNGVFIKKLADYFKVPMEMLTNEKSKEEEKKEEKFWYDRETSEMAQQIFNNKELKLLFSSARDAKPEDLKIVNDMLLALKKKEKGG